MHAENVGQRGSTWIAAVLYGLTGLCLAFLMARPITIIGPRPWYESFFLPLIAAVVLFTIVSAWGWASGVIWPGLLLTGPPYLCFLVMYLRGGESSGVERWAGIGIALCLAASGALLLPLITALVMRLSGKQRS